MKADREPASGKLRRCGIAHEPQRNAIAPHRGAGRNRDAVLAVEHLLQLNSDYLALVHALKSAKKVYEVLPQGHRELLKSVQKQPTGFEAIKNLYEEGKRLKSIYDELKPTATSTTKG